MKGYSSLVNRARKVLLERAQSTSQAPKLLVVQPGCRATDEDYSNFGLIIRLSDDKNPMETVPQDSLDIPMPLIGACV